MLSISALSSSFDSVLVRIVSPLAIVSYRINSNLLCRKLCMALNSGFNVEYRKNNYLTDFQKGGFVLF